MISPGTTIRCSVTSNEIELMEQIYRFEAGERSLEVDQVWQSLTAEKAHGGCSFAVTPVGCRDFRFRARRDADSYEIEVEESATGVVMRSSGIVCSSLPAADSPLLFDCDDPMLDWINTFMILGLQQGESARHDVHYIDLRSCAVSRRSSLFTWQDGTITIVKSPDPRHDCRLRIHDGGFGLRQAEAAGFIYNYE